MTYNEKVVQSIFQYPNWEDVLKGELIQWVESQYPKEWSPKTPEEYVAWMQPRITHLKEQAELSEDGMRSVGYTLRAISYYEIARQLQEAGVEPIQLPLEKGVALRYRGYDLHEEECECGGHRRAYLVSLYILHPLWDTMTPQERLDWLFYQEPLADFREPKDTWAEADAITYCQENNWQIHRIDE